MTSALATRPTTASTTSATAMNSAQADQTANPSAALRAHQRLGSAATRHDMLRVFLLALGVILGVAAVMVIGGVVTATAGLVIGGGITAGFAAFAAAFTGFALLNA